MTTVTVLKPGDNVLVTFPEDIDMDSVLDGVARLRERFPGVEFTAMKGAETVVVQRQEDGDG